MLKGEVRKATKEELEKAKKVMPDAPIFKDEDKTK